MFSRGQISEGRGANIPGNLARGGQIWGGAKFPGTPAHMNAHHMT